jgi:hypothetical protein
MKRRWFGLASFILLGIFGRVSPALAIDQCLGICNFLYSQGAFTPLSVPGSLETNVDELNNSGQIVGGYFKSGSDIAHVLYIIMELTPRSTYREQTLHI